MSRPPARFTESELKRALKAAREVGGDEMAVRVLSDGSIEIYRKVQQEEALAPKRRWVT